MIARRLQCIFAGFFLALAPALAEAELAPGSVAALTFKDVDGNDIFTAGGHITIITVITRDQDAAAQAVADQMPAHCLGDPKYRYVTLINFQGKIAKPLRGLTRTIIRARLDGEARKLKSKFEARQIAGDARRHIFVVADFDGDAVRQLGLSPTSATPDVFVFDARGKLIEKWEGRPPPNSLPGAIAEAERSTP